MLAEGLSALIEDLRMVTPCSRRLAAISAAMGIGKPRRENLCRVGDASTAPIQVPVCFLLALAVLVHASAFLGAASVIAVLTAKLYDGLPCLC